MLGQRRSRDAGEESDWARVRAEFPVTETYAYLNSAGAGARVARASAAAAASSTARPVESGDRLWEEWLARRERARADVARLINAEPDEIAFTTNTSSGMNLIVDALEGARRVVSCELGVPRLDHHVDAPRRARPSRQSASRASCATEDVLGAMRATRRASSASATCSTRTASALDPRGGRREARAATPSSSTRASRRACCPIDVKRMRVDALCATGHKWMLAGYGSGFVYLSRELLERDAPARRQLDERRRPFRDAQRLVHAARRRRRARRDRLPALRGHLRARREPRGTCSTSAPRTSSGARSRSTAA